MIDNDFIATPIYPKKPTNHIEGMFLDDQPWQRRARKLRDRRWRKLASRIAVKNDSYLQSRHPSH